MDTHLLHKVCSWGCNGLCLPSHRPPHLTPIQVVLENFERGISADNKVQVLESDIAEFALLWRQHADERGLVSVQDLDSILLHLPPPLGRDLGSEGREVGQLIAELKIPMVDGKLSYNR